MRIAYVIISHRNPAQVLRLVRALKEGPAAEVFVRHDQRASALSQHEIERAGGRVAARGREIVWGEWSHFVAMLDLFEEVAGAVDPDWLLLLSGQDYPLRPMPAIETALQESEFDALLGDAWKLELDGLPDPPHDEFFLRYAYRHYAAPRRAPHLPGGLRRVAYLRERPAPLRPLVGVRRLGTPFSARFGCFVSSDWQTLRRPALEAVLRAARERQNLMRYYRRTWVPAESFFASVLLNDPGLRVATENRRFHVFPGPLTPHPVTLTTADLDRVLSSGCDFARKFDAEQDGNVLDAIDERRRSASPR